MGRTPHSDKNGLKKGTWTPEEDRKLVAYVTRYGCWNWRQLPKYAGLSRCGKSCRLRWMNYLRPNIRRGNYTKEEEDTIIKLHESLGNRWSAIAAQLPGRTDNEIKNHWHTTLKKRLKQDSLQNNYLKQKKPKDEQTSQDGESKQNTIIKEDQEKKVIRIKTTPQCPHILESSSNSSIPADTAVVKNTENLNVENHVDVAYFEPYVEPIGNFWTEPFFPDDSYDFNISGYFQSPLVNPEYVHSPLLLDGDIILC